MVLLPFDIYSFYCIFFLFLNYFSFIYMSLCTNSVALLGKIWYSWITKKFLGTIKNNKKQNAANRPVANENPQRVYIKIKNRNIHA